MAKDKDQAYLCGSGSAMNHFEQTPKACAAYPWNSDAATTCEVGKANAKWQYGGAYVVQGEQEMMEALSKNESLYVMFSVPSNFMSAPAGQVFNNQAGAIVGAHATACVGYGTQGGVKYWLIQNSWGDEWADMGYVKFLRGTNFMGIEEIAVYFQGWSVGDHQPAPVGKVFSAVMEEERKKADDEEARAKEDKAIATTGAHGGFDVADAPTMVLVGAGVGAVALVLFVRSACCRPKHKELH